MTLITFRPSIDPRAALSTGAGSERLERLLHDRTLGKTEKRSILSGWASDANAVEDRPWLRQLPGSDEHLPLAAILTALRRLDDDDPPPRGGAAIRLPRLARDNGNEDAGRPHRFRRTARQSHAVARRSDPVRFVEPSAWLRRRGAPYSRATR